MSIKLISDNKLWDEFVDSSPDGLLFHKWNFLEAMAEFTGYTLENYGIYDDSELIALFPIFSKSLFGFKTLFSPPPQTNVPYLGFIMNSDYYSSKQDRKESLLSIVVNDFNKLVKDNNYNYVTVSLVPNFLDVRQFEWDSYDANLSYTYMIDLAQSHDEIFDGFKRTIRKQIKKATSHNLVMEKSDNLSLLYNMEKERYGQQGLNSPIVSQKYLEKIFSLYPQNLSLYSIYDNERNIISTALIHEYNGKLLLLIGGMRTEENIGVNEFIIWELIKKAKEENYKFFDMVGANKKSICTFKSQFNPVLGFNYTIKKQDFMGRLAEYIYLQFIKKI
jgi:lipid II:glycine glycyltransferase (peptidoglycan interpeptide bridge formation enzyme)